jgi:hypothetical protein
MPLQGGFFVCPASFHGRESACGISLGLPTDVFCLAQSTQRSQRCLVGCRAPINGCRCEMAYGYRTEDAPSPSVIPWARERLWNLLGIANRCHISRAEDAERAEISCWLSCADAWLSHFRRTYRRSLLRLYFFSACRKSAIKSSASSIPAEIRINSAGMSWAEPAACVKIRGNSIKLSTPPKLTA